MDIDHSGPRIHCLLLRTCINPPHPPLLTSYAPSPPSSPTACLLTGSSNHSGFTCPRPSIPRKIRPLPFLACYHHITTLPFLPCPHHACQIPVAAAPTLLPKSLLAWSSAAIPWLSDATTVYAPSPCPQTPSLSHKPRILVAG